MVILQAIQDFGNWFWGIPILILIGGGGLFLTIYLGFPQIRHFGYAMSQTFGKMFAKKEEGKVRPISAAFAALACAVGASNIVGVPVAIALGVVLVLALPRGTFRGFAMGKETPKREP